MFSIDSLFCVTFLFFHPFLNDLYLNLVYVALFSTFFPYSLPNRPICSWLLIFLIFFHLFELLSIVNCRSSSERESLKLSLCHSLTSLRSRNISLNLNAFSFKNSSSLNQRHKQSKKKSIGSLGYDVGCTHRKIMIDNKLLTKTLFVCVFISENAWNSNQCVTYYCDGLSANE